MSYEAFEVQNQIKQSMLQTHESIKGMKQWEAEMKEKELGLQKQQSSEDNNKPIPIRSKIDEFQKFNEAEESLNKIKTMSIAADNKASEEQIDYAARKQEALGFKEKGNTFVQKKEYEPALKMYSRAIELCNDDPVFYSNRSQCYLSLEKYKECIEDATRAIELDPKSAKSFYRQMMAYEKLGDDFKALRSCRQWLDFSPDDQTCKNNYDKIHNRIMDAERKKDKEKIRWARLGSTAEVVNFVSRPPHLRSKKPTKKVPVRLRKAASPIHEAIIDKIFGNNTGERTPEPETDSKLFRPNFLIADPFKSSQKLIESPKAEKSVEAKAEMIVAQERQAPNEAADVPTLEELEAQKTHLISIPLTSVQFYSAWKELNEVQKFLYLKNIAENSVPIGKLLGAQIDSEILSNILTIVHKYFSTFKIPAIRFLNDLGKNSEVAVLAMFLNDEEKSKITELIMAAQGDGDNSTQVTILEIKNSFLV